MQRLEVSCAVRVIYTSFGAKGLQSEPKFCRQTVYRVLVRMDGTPGQTLSLPTPKTTGKKAGLKYS